MPYSLWSHGRLLGHTDLDIPCVQSHLRQGFIDPTELGERLLPDAVGVPAACVELHRIRKLRGSDDWAADSELFRAAVERREALDLKLRDENGDDFEFDFVRVYDLRDTSWEDDIDDDEDDIEVDAEFAAAIEEDLASLRESDMYGSTWSPVDERWDTMRYHIMVHLDRPDDDAGW